ncbi:hypothetical protein [Agromyces mangrovi Wang et al. 2018]|uniref:hypothetical protein n=1 Tax=Agromyces mangrovi TaxID=1858653 RepID=UPI002574212E|nr:hypothetical protein [Agromyces mangrovi]BDZ65659.1 hypothetical protein GCM10025877_25970 [Agromyces mangrovi]
MRTLMRWLLGAGVALLGLVVAAVWVRVSLAWSDSRGWEGQATEIRYLVFACIALAIAAAGLVLGVLVGLGRLRRRR